MLKQSAFLFIHCISDYFTEPATLVSADPFASMEGLAAALVSFAVFTVDLTSETAVDFTSFAVFTVAEVV